MHAKHTPLAPPTKLRILLIRKRTREQQQ